MYDKYTGGVTRFTNVGTINDDLLRLERDCQGDSEPPPVATHLLCAYGEGIVLQHLLFIRSFCKYKYQCRSTFPHCLRSYPHDRKHRAKGDLHHF